MIYARPVSVLCARDTSRVSRMMDNMWPMWSLNPHPALYSWPGRNQYTAILSLLTQIEMVKLHQPPAKSHQYNSAQCNTRSVSCTCFMPVEAYIGGRDRWKPIHSHKLLTFPSCHSGMVNEWGSNALQTILAYSTLLSVLLLTPPCHRLTSMSPVIKPSLMGKG